MCEIITFDELKTRLKLSQPNLSDYPELESIKSSVEYAIKSYVDREFCLGTYVEQVDSSYIAGNLLPLRAIPIIELKSIQVLSGDSGYSDISNYTVGFAWLKSLTTLPELQLKITYDGGLEEMPDALKRACLLQTLFEFQSKNEVAAIRLKQPSGGEIERPPLGLLDEVKRLLTDYVHPAKDFIMGHKRIISFTETV